MRVMHTDGVRESTVLIGGWRAMEGDKEPSGGSLMATTGLKIAALITGNKEVEALYDHWVDKLGYRDPKRTAKSIMGPKRGNYDDTDHLLPDLYLLNLIEDETKPGRLFRSVEIDLRGARKPFLSVSDDGGKSWRPILKQLTELIQWASGTGETANLTRDEMRQLLAYASSYPIRDVRVDSKDPQRWYGLMDSGVAVTEDEGENWIVSNLGLDIPSVQSLWKPRETNDLYVGTPAGLYVSRDGAKTWQDTSLILQYPGVGREEIGGAAYIQAYWLGRYEGFIDEEEANRIWWK